MSDLEYGDATCPVCGTKHETTGRWAEGVRGVHRETPDDPPTFTPDDDGKCPACLALGGAPPESPCCKQGLYGHEGDEWSLACWGCDTVFPLDSIRAYALGLAVQRIVEESNAPLTYSDSLDFAAAILRESAKLGIRRKP